MGGSHYILKKKHDSGIYKRYENRLENKLLKKKKKNYSFILAYNPIPNAHYK